MKASSVRQCSMAVAVGLAFFLGCARPSAQTEPQKAIVSPITPVPAVAVDQAPPGAPDPTAPKPDGDTNAPAIIERIPPSTRPEAVATTSGISEVAKLAQAGVNEQVMLAFVEKYNGRFDVGADQIVYLNDLGVSSTVITAMLKHDDAKAPGAAAEAPPHEVSTAATPPANPPVTTSAAPPPTSSAEVSYFYDSLSAYGSWIYISGYGWCWQPTVAVSPTWRPYCDKGGWYWSDSGWYWNSDYSWGWAAFHYGRWYHHGGCGWVWTPGVVWGPSWVSWRYQNGYCGWAPLPPAAHYVSGVGFTYYGSHVSVGFEFGLTAFHYSFVQANHFCDPAPYHHLVARPAVANIYRNTTVINNYGAGNHNTVINRGIGKETIARSGGGRVREVTVRETPPSDFAGGRNQKPERQGNQLVAYRPQLPQTPPTVRTAPNSGRGNVGNTVIGRPASGGGGNSVAPVTAPRSQPGVGNRGISEVTRSIPGTGTVPSNPNVGGRQNAPRNNERVTTLTPGRALPPQSVTRRDDSLFGDSGAERTQPRNNTPTVQTPPHTVPQKFPPSVTGIPRNPNPPLATTHQGTPRAEQQNNAPQTRLAPNNPYQSPRQYEQTPHRIGSAPAANPAPQYSRPAPNSSPSQGQSAPTSGGSSGNSGPSRGVRNH